MKIAIAGWPRTGKTTFALELGGEVRHTDDLISQGWSVASEMASAWFDILGPSAVVEGVAVPRALRKWLKRNAEGKPCDVVYYFDKPHEPLSTGQTAMAKGCDTVWSEIRTELRARGVEIRKHAIVPPADAVADTPRATELRHGAVFEVHPDPLDENDSSPNWSPEE